MLPLFNTITLQDEENLELLKTLSLEGRQIPIIKYSYELNELRPGDIIRSPWGRLLYVDNVLAHTSAKNKYIFLHPKLQEKILKTSGVFDLIFLNPVAGIIFFIPALNRYVPRIDYYNHCGIIFDDKVYECWDMFNTKITNLNDREIELKERKAVCIHYPIDPNLLERQLHQGSDSLRFVTRVCGYSIHKGIEPGRYSADSYFKNYSSLYYYLHKQSRRNINVEYQRISNPFLN